MGALLKWQPQFFFSWSQTNCTSVLLIAQLFPSVLFVHFASLIPLPLSAPFALPSLILVPNCLLTACGLQVKARAGMTRTMRPWGRRKRAVPPSRDQVSQSANHVACTHAGCAAHTSSFDLLVDLCVSLFALHSAVKVPYFVFR